MCLKKLQQKLDSKAFLGITKYLLMQVLDKQSKS